MKRSIAASTATWPTPTRRSASSWNASTTSNDCTRLWAMSRPPSLSKTAGVSNDVASRRTFQLGTLPPNPRDLSHSRRNDGARRQITLPPLIPAVESALELRPRRALSSAQVFPEWITATSPRNDLSANGDYPLDLLYHPKGSVHTCHWWDKRDWSCYRETLRSGRSIRLHHRSARDGVGFSGREHKGKRHRGARRCVSNR